ncbi:unnamed protein product [Rotaria socialis]|uniref:Uncharacterized protein n=1 Tax=Rotaria socialis TaxID=392032 RepID=A0A820V5B2_9BILA|nr:unnamed protein product [Rotaria socialis]CAF4494702.1 unnamed protein product [Rotaria socialis]
MLELEKNPVLTNQQRKQLDMKQQVDHPPEKRITNQERKRLEIEAGISQQKGRDRDGSNQGTHQGISQIQGQVDDPPEKRITNQERKRLEIEAGIIHQPVRGRDESNQGTDQGISQIQEQVDDPPEKRITNQERKRLEIEAGISQQKGRGRDGSNQVRHPSTWTHQGISRRQEQVDDSPEKIITNQERKRSEEDTVGTKIGYTSTTGYSNERKSYRSQCKVPASYKDDGCAKEPRRRVVRRIRPPKDSPLDLFGNPASSQYDLAPDGSMYPFRLLIGKFYNGEGFTVKSFIQHVGQMLDQKGFDWYITEEEDDFLEKLNSGDYIVAWIISFCSLPTLVEQFSAAILKYHNAGNGLFLFGENDIASLDKTNIALQAIFGSEYLLEGNTPGQGTLKPSPDPFTSGHFLQDHLIMAGIESLYEGITICYPRAQHSELQVLATSTNGHSCILCRDIDDSKGRVVVDVGFTKLFEQYWNTAGTGRYVINVSCWLTGVNFID